MAKNLLKPAMFIAALASSMGIAMKADVSASFSAQQCKTDIYSCGFDTPEEFNTWEQEGAYGGWKLTSNPFGNSAPAFTSINPGSKASLYFPRVMEQRDESIISPSVTIEKGDHLSFWSVTSPIWLFYARTKLIVVDETNETTLWDNFLWFQEHPTDDIQWIKFEYPLDQFAGKNVRLKFLYTGNDGDPIMIDDVKISRNDNSETAKVTINQGEDVNFLNLSEGDIVSYNWNFPGGNPSTSTEQYPTVNYPSAGTYDVELEVTDSNGAKSTSVRHCFVNVQTKALEASIGIPEGIYYSPEAGIVVPLLHQLTFKDQTEGTVENRQWLFPGTATPTSSEESPTVYYTTPGQYDVDLTVANSTGSSLTYIHGVRAGLPSLVWNIPAKENTDLAPISLGWYGYYGGTNWLDMPAFAEYFSAPLEPAEISEVNLYFAAATIDPASKDLPLTVAICKNVNGLPGDILASTSLPCSDLIDASVTVNDPTTFFFDEPVKVTGDFFVTVGNFPNNETDDIALYCSPRREDMSKSTVYHLLLDLDENYQPTGTSTWVKNTDESLSFAIAPKIVFEPGTAGISLPSEDMPEATLDPNMPVEYFTISGQRLPMQPSLPGIYLKRQGMRSSKIVIQ